MKVSSILYEKKRTCLIILGLFIIYVAQVNPSAVLTMIMKEYQLTMSQGGICVSIIYFPTILFSLVGPQIQAKLGLKKMFTVAVMFVSAGVLFNLFAGSYFIFLLGRILYGIGYGISIPFIGAAIAKWYEGEQQVFMNTMNAVSPYLGNVVVYGLTLPLVSFFDGSWKMAIAVWGGIGLLCILIWGVSIKCDVEENQDFKNMHAKEKEIYRNLIKRKEILILVILFALDFFCYSIITSLLPTIYQTEYGLDINLANNLTIFFPVGAIAGAGMAYGIMEKTRQRKIILWVGQLLKALGAVAIGFGGADIPGVVGVVMFGIGSCIWTPAMYVISAELPDMTSERVGGAFSLITSSGFAAGLISPVIASWFGEIVGMKAVIILCAVPSLIAMAACLLIRETGPGKENM